jgi:predicted nucleic acid-binding protein
MLVIDASAVTELLLGRGSGERVAALVETHDHDLHAPHLLDIEVLSALRRLVARDLMSPARAEDAVEDLLDLRIERYPHVGLLDRAWQLRHDLSAYDASYVALAEALAEEEASSVTLLTADRRLARAAAAHSDVRVMSVVGSD